VEFDDLFGPNGNVVHLKAADRWEAINELIAELAAAGKIRARDSAEISQAVKKRESAMSTGIGFNVAMPHASTNLVDDPVFIAGVSKKGISFDSLDGKPVNFVVLFLVPAGNFEKVLNILAKTAKLLHNQQFRDELRRRYL
jgi:mannitol/fructose-specific phosphotransferase system IIA component (Ntr-type)